MLKIWVSPSRHVPDHVARKAKAEFEDHHGDIALPGINVGGAMHPRSCANCNATVWAAEMYGPKSECDSCRKKVGFA